MGDGGNPRAHQIGRLEPRRLSRAMCGKRCTSLGAVSFARYDSPIDHETPAEEPVEMLVAIEYCVV
jgi:hypothetical protein